MALGRRMLEELGLTLSLMTRLKLPRFDVRTDATLASAVWAHPVAGAVAGAVSAGTAWFVFALTPEPGLAAILALAAGLLVTGALHEDGLADFWDGLGGGATPAARLEIMRDSRLGTYGALALIVVLGAKVMAMSVLLQRFGVGGAPAAILAAAILGRSAMALPLAALSPARRDGMGAHVVAVPAMALAGSVALGLLAAFLLLGAGAVVAALGAFGAGAILAALAARHLGGQTGDVLGCVASTAEAGALLALVAWS